MFFIVNKTKKSIILGDISISLGPRQARDLDKTMGREKSDNSKHLKAAVKKGIIQIKRKDGIEKVKIIKEVIADSGLDKAKDEIMNEMKKEMNKLRDHIKTGKDGITSEELTKIMKDVISNLPQSTTTIIREKGGESLREDDEVEIDEEVLSDIHKRAVNELIRGVVPGDMNYKEEKSESDELDNNISELEDLLNS